VAEVALVPHITDEMLASDDITYLAPLGIMASIVYYGQTRTALVFFNDHTNVAGPSEPPVTSFTPRIGVTVYYNPRYWSASFGCDIFLSPAGSD
jgi:hypothetical protein